MQVSYAQAISKIAKSERYNTSVEHYLGKYDIVLHVIYGKDLYSGAADCANYSKNFKKRGVK